MNVGRLRNRDSSPREADANNMIATVTRTIIEASQGTALTAEKAVRNRQSNSDSATKAFVDVWDRILVSR